MIGNTNSGIFKGTVYVERYIVLNERHKFFKKPNFIVGSVEYDGQPYFNIHLKYDLFDDELLVGNLDLIGSPVIQLDKDKITQFIIDEHKFENIHVTENKNNSLSGFFEVLIKNDVMILYKRHGKKIIRKANKKIRYYEFKDNNLYYVYYNDSYFRLKKINDLNAIFPNYKTQLKNIYARYKSIRKTHPDTYMKSILMDLYSVMFSNNNSLRI